MLEPDWISRHAGDFDVLHVHFGFESFSIAALSSALDALAAAGRPLIFTVHDLENPQLADQSHHLAQLDLLISRAAELITLTAGAAAEIRRRWGRGCTVIAHPRMLALELPPPVEQLICAQSEIAPGRFTVGLHLRDLRPSIDGLGATRGLAGAIDLLRAQNVQAHGRIVLFDTLRDPAAAGPIRALAANAPHLSLTEQPRASEAALAADLSALQVSLLPYRHGTHSGWAELCWDLAVPVVGTPVGYVAEQHDDLGWFTAADPTDPGSLAGALSHLAQSNPLGSDPQPSRARARVVAMRRELRARQRPGLARLHRAVYLRTLSRLSP
jgi:hypothetical protein